MTRHRESKRPPFGAFGGAEKGVAPPPLSPGLWLVSTPIGNARDITLRAIDVLEQADVLACEDTRRTRKLMDIHAIPLRGRPMVAYNDQNGAARRPVILDHLNQGKSVAYASDAGTPLIADPGYQLVRSVRSAGHSVHVVPGPSSVPAALCLAGLPTDRFLFAGFLPAKQAARRRALEALAKIDTTLVFFESPRRLAECLADMAETLGPERHAAILREITKLHEETKIASLGDLAEEISNRSAPKGEIVLVIEPPAPAPAAQGESLDAMIRAALADSTVKEASQFVAQATGLSRREVYSRALEIAAET